MNDLNRIFKIKELVRCGHMTVQDGRKEVVELIEQSVFYPAMNARYRHLITLIDTSLYVNELVDGIDNYLNRLSILCDEMQKGIDQDFSQRALSPQGFKLF